MNSFTASSSHLLAIANGTDLYEHSLQLKLKLQFASSFESSFKSCVQNVFDCVDTRTNFISSYIQIQLRMPASPPTSESIAPWELPIVVSNEFLVDCLGVSLSGPSHVQCMCRYRQGCATRDSAA